MRCRKCRQPESPVGAMLANLEKVEAVSVLTACSGYVYEGHVNLPNRPFILFGVKHLGTLESLWRQVFSKLIVPASLIYNGSRQFLFEIDLPQEWPNRDKMLTEVWFEISKRMKEFK